jgi:hypothetical protein
VKLTSPNKLSRRLNQVRVHADAKAAESARAVNALADTAGQTVVFGESKYEPNTRAGRELLAHELADTVQYASLNLTSTGKSADLVRTGQ